MEKKERPPLGTLRARLPWIVAIVALVLYLVTLNRWVRLESLGVLARVAGWDWTPATNAPLHFLVTLPFSWLSASVQPIALNVLSAVMAALTLALLARAICLLPYDRTRETRVRERSEHGLLSLPLAWAPPVFGVLALGLQLTFWEHATAATGEMLDLLLFAYVVRCLLEFRLDRRDRWLFQCALVYGVGMTNNYAMIAFFPLFLIAVVYLTGWDFFRPRFLGLMLALGVAGLVLYLVLPLAAMVGGNESLSFWRHLKMVLGQQKQILLVFPKYLIFLLGLQCLIPVLVLSVRWPGNVGDTSAAGAMVTAFITRFVHIVMLVLCYTVFLDLDWGPRALGFGLAFLPLYFLAALGVGYFTGYLLLVFTPAATKSRRRRSTNARFLGGLATGLVLLAGVAVPVYLVAKNLPSVRATDGRTLKGLADLLIRDLPRDGSAYVISDNENELRLAEAALRSEAPDLPHIMLRSSLLEFRVYHERLAEVYAGRWPTIPEVLAEIEALPKPYVTTVISGLALSNRVFYLHPSMGHFFEPIWQQPRGIAVELTARSVDPALRKTVTQDELVWNEAFWTEAKVLADRLPTPRANDHPQVEFVRAVLSRGANSWGVTLQRHDDPSKAGPWFELAQWLNEDNVQAEKNLEFNRQLVAGAIEEIDFTQPVTLRTDYTTWDELILRNGPFDHPAYAFRVGHVFAQGSLFRQSVDAFSRVSDYFPTNTLVTLWRQNMESMAWLAIGETEKAEALARAQLENHPTSELVLETLTQLYTRSMRWDEASAIVERRLELNPDNEVALINLAAISIARQDFAKAIPPMTRILERDPENSGALMNRAIAYLQNGDLDLAERDYRALLEQTPEYHAVYFGLGEIAIRRRQPDQAIKHFELYLEHANPDTKEYREVQERLKLLKQGAAAP